MLKKQVERSVLSGGSALQKLNDRLGRLNREIRDKTKILDGFSEKIRELAISTNQNMVDVCNMIISEKEKIESELCDLTSEVSLLEHKMEKIEKVADGNAAEKWIRKTMKSFAQNPCVRKKAILSTIFKEIIYRDGKLEYKVNLDPEAIEIASPTRKKGKKKAVSEEDSFLVTQMKWRERRDSNSRPPA